MSELATTRIPQVPDNPFPPGSILSPEDVAQGLMELTDRLEKGTRFLHQKIDEFDGIDEEYQLAYAQALFDETARNAEQRKAGALLACRDLYHRRRVAETLLKTTKERLHTLRVMIEVGRSLGAAARVGMDQGQQPGR